MINHCEINQKDLLKAIRKKEIHFAANRKLGIYGRLDCSVGKRMKKENRVFFASEKDAIENGFRPCGHCMKEKYKKWKND